MSQTAETPGNISSQDKEIPPDTLNQSIGVLTRREAEARVLAPVLAALGEEFGHVRVQEIVRDQIVEIAREQGRSLVRTIGSDSLVAFADSLESWTRDDALAVDILEQTDEVFSFNVTRCRYAELYRALGIPELGAVLSCNRDFALVQGFNENVDLTRTQTIMEGASHCDFRYRLGTSAQDPQGA